MKNCQFSLEEKTIKALEKYVSKKKKDQQRISKSKVVDDAIMLFLQGDK